MNLHLALGKELEDLDLPMLLGQSGCVLAVAIPKLGVSPSSKEDLDNLDMAKTTGVMEGSLAGVVLNVEVNLELVGKQVDHLSVTPKGGLVKSSAT